MIKAPAFWYRGVGIRGLTLLPFGLVYWFLSNIRRWFSKPFKANVPIISVGNIVLGGAGKTPTTLALAKLLTSNGYSPAIVSRGYGGKLKGPVRVSPEKYTFKEVGDEPLLLAQEAPTYIAKQRALGVQMAQQEGATVIILDDGHQNVQVHKDFSFVVVGADQKFGNKLVFPAGPLREPLSAGLKRASAIIYVGEGEFSADDLPVFRAKLHPKPFPLAGKRIVAFCGLGFPRKFKETLLHLGCKIDNFIEYPDHHPYTDKDMKEIISSSYGAPLVTTSKDFARVPRIYDHLLHVVEIELIFDDPAQVLGFLQ